MTSSFYIARRQSLQIYARFDVSLHLSAHKINPDNHQHYFWHHHNPYADYYSVVASVEATKRLVFQTLHAIQDSGACVNVCDWQIRNIRFSWGDYSWYCLLSVCWQSGRKGWKGRWTGRLTEVFVHQSKVRCDSSALNLPLSSSCQRPCSSFWQTHEKSMWAKYELSIKQKSSYYWTSWLLLGFHSENFAILGPFCDVYSKLAMVLAMFL